MTEKSSTWLGRGAHGGVTEEAGKKARPCKGRPERQARQGSSYWLEGRRDLSAQVLGPGLEADISPEADLAEDDSSPTSLIPGLS